MALCDSPELSKFIQRYLTIAVKVHLIKEFTRRKFSKRALPMLEGFITIYLITAIYVENLERLINFILALLS